MRIVIDARAYGWAGIGRYTRNLVRELTRPEGRHDFVIATGQENAASIRRDLVGHKFELAVVDGGYYGWREQTALWRQLSRIKADLWHFTHFNVPLLFKRPYVVTIHDVTRFIFPGQTQQALVKQLVYEQVFKRAVERARAVICVSEYTRREIKSLPIKIGRVQVIGEAVENNYRRRPSAIERQRARLLVGTNDPYILYVGVWMGHKNLPRLLAAFKSLSERRADLKLVLTGRPRPGYVAVDKIARQLEVADERIIYLGFVPETLLPGLYAGAACVALPSLYEGFGLPALEAQALGVPVVASGVTSLPEILADGAYLVNPEYMPDIARALQQAIGDGPKKIVPTGALNAKWAKIASQVEQVYEAVK